MKVNYDKETEIWLKKNPAQQTTVMLCDKCGLFFKPSLGHKCIKEVVKNDTDKRYGNAKKVY